VKILEHLTTLDYRFDSSCEITNLVALNYPTVVSVTPFGVSGTTVYSYRISSKNQFGESLASISYTTQNIASLNSQNFNRIMWSIVDGATSYKIYGRSSNQELFIAEVSDTNYYDDNGSITPNGSLPQKNTSGYDHTKLSLGKFAKVFTSNKNKEDNFVSLIKPNLIPLGMDLREYYNIDIYFDKISSIKYGNDIIYSVINRRIANNYKFFLLYEYRKSTGAFTFKGQIQCNHESAAYTDLNDFRISNYTFSNGTASANNFLVQGVDTSFVDSRITIGARIGFGATEPSLITQWYEITAIISNNLLTIDTNVEIPLNTPYVIEELRIYFAVEIGIYVVKGIHFGLFSLSKTTFPTVNMINENKSRCIFRLRHPSMSLVRGFTLGPIINNSTQYLYVVNSSTSLDRNTSFFVFNCLENFISSGGQVYNAFVLNTDTSNALSSHFTNRNNCLVYADINDGIFNEPSLYLMTRFSIFRIPVKNIVQGTNNLFKDYSYYGSLYFGRSYSFSYDWNSSNPTNLTYDKETNTFLAHTQSRNYVSLVFGYGRKNDYPRSFLGNGYGRIYRHRDSRLKDVLFCQFNGSFDVVDGYLIDLGQSLDNNSGRHANFLQIFPYGADFSLDKYADNYIICPAIDISFFKSIKQININFSSFVSTGEFAMPTENFRVYYRNTGIEDNTGNWILIDKNKDLSYLPTNKKIQIMFSLRNHGQTGISAEIFSYHIVGVKKYSLPKEFKWNINNSNNLGTFGFDQIKIANSLNYLKISIYDENNDLILYDDSLSNNNGNFQYFSSNTWSNGIGSNQINTMRKYIPSVPLLNLGSIRAEIEIN
jgi:hypothetical protein